MNANRLRSFGSQVNKTNYLRNLAMRKLVLSLYTMYHVCTVIVGLSCLLFCAVLCPKSSLVFVVSLFPWSP